MKIRKRRQTLDFGALAQGVAAEFDDAEALDMELEVAPDFDLSPAEPPPLSPDEALFAPKEPPKAAPAPALTAAPETAADEAPAAEAPSAEPQKPAAEPAPAPKPPAPEAPTPKAAAPVEPAPPEATRSEPARPAAFRGEPAAPKPQGEPPSAAVQAEPQKKPEAPQQKAWEIKPAAERSQPTAAPAPLARSGGAAPLRREPQGRPPGAAASQPSRPAAASPIPGAATSGRSAARSARPTSERSAARRPVEPTSSGWPIYLGAAGATLAWIGALAVLTWTSLGLSSGRTLDPMLLAGLAALAIGPVALIWVSAYLARQGMRLATEAARAKALADDMVSPAVIAAGRAGDLVQAVREEIVTAGRTAKEARESLLALRQALAAETERLAETTAASTKAAETLAQTLGRERTDMAGLAQALEAQAASAVEAIGRQSRIVADASDLAETQLREAEASLTARAADLTAAAGSAADVARTAGEDLTRHIARLESAGGGVAEQINAVEAGLVEQRAALVAASQTLRADQEVFAAEAESQTAKLSEFIAQARLSASEMGDRAIKGADALRGLIAEAADQFREFSDQAKVEREAFGASTKQSLEAVAAAAAEERAKLEAQTRASIEALGKAAEETRQAAERHAEAARAQVDQLAEAAFTAGQRANQVFEARLAEARDLIERSAQMVEQAGAATAKKLDEGANAARGTLQELEKMLQEIESRASQLPAAARQQAEEVRNAVIQGMDQLMEHARRTAEETEAIDLAFQERVRRNYEMLSEAVRLMGAVATNAGPAPAPRSVPGGRPGKGGASLAEPAPAATPAAEMGLRQRLRLTPTASDQEFSEVFDAAGGRTPEPAEAGDGWTWKELLSSIDETDEAAPETQGEVSLIAEITSMGIDPAALLPRARMEEIADLLQNGEADACRTLVRRLAPAATRRLARRLFTDAPLKQQVRRYVARHQRLLADAAKRDKDGLELGALLASDAGRAFLLLDAAAGDGA